MPMNERKTSNIFINSTGEEELGFVLFTIQPLALLGFQSFFGEFDKKKQVKLKNMAG